MYLGGARKHHAFAMVPTWPLDEEVEAPRRGKLEIESGFRKEMELEMMA